jgi:hypothetical protein
MGPSSISDWWSWLQSIDSQQLMFTVTSSGSVRLYRRGYYTCEYRTDTQVQHCEMYDLWILIQLKQWCHLFAETVCRETT